MLSLTFTVLSSCLTLLNKGSRNAYQLPYQTRLPKHCVLVYSVKKKSDVSDAVKALNNMVEGCKTATYFMKMMGYSFQTCDSIT